MTQIHLQQLSHTDDEEILTQRSHPMRRLRLQSLEQDADCFHSKYDDEKDQPTKFWLDRLRDENAMHWIAYDSDEMVLGAEQHGESSGRWVAFLVVLAMGKSPFVLPQDTMPHGKPDVLDHYQLAALYVYPTYRGKRLATSLIRAALATIQSSHTETSERKVIVTLEVQESNHSAQRIYSDIGFVRYEVEAGGSGNDSRYKFGRMRLELSC